ncbi:multidrug ABC transporter permease [Actinocatenispora thailandica]|uniref:Multidrug ABC transporter permease n=2 Tax=Actinocatenispora thailandica TaxID=227318 RepID=A0A7R7HVQ7_9ACTN|nr:multidrug ABC transporter permease [Actinocatenispora thailandica]
MRLIAVARKAGWGWFIALWIVNLARMVLPTIVGLAMGLLVSRLLADGEELATVSALVSAACGLMLLAHTTETVGAALTFSVSQRLDGWHQHRISRLVGGPQGIGHLEDPAVRNDLEEALLKGLPGWASYSFGTGATGQIAISARTVGSCFAALVLGRFSWPLAIGLLAVTFVVRMCVRREWLGQHGVVRKLTPVTRKAHRWADVVASPWAAKESRIFGLGDWAIGRHQRLMSGRVLHLAAIRARVLRKTAFLVVPLGVAVLAGLGTLVWAAAAAKITPGSLAIYLGAFWGVVAANGMDYEAFDVHFAGLPTLLALDHLQSRLSSSSESSLHPYQGSTAPPVVRFSAIKFHYPGASRPVLDGFDLEIASGEKLAIVGMNGAGKSTMLKLLSGMYRPSAGQLTIDGRSLDDYGARAWQKRLAVVLQNFVHYDLSLRENIVLGASQESAHPGLLDIVARQAGIEDLLGRMQLGWDTPLSARYQGGVELSGGQWQRIALARALYAVARGAQLLVLDEPTAHLDVRAELDVFSRVLDAAEGASVVLISHRLSSVRKADRIVLIDDGRVVEDGGHDQLVALGGRYAKMFALQADRFGDHPAHGGGDAT